VSAHPGQVIQFQLNPRKCAQTQVDNIRIICSQLVASTARLSVAIITFAVQSFLLLEGLLGSTHGTPVEFPPDAAISGSILMTARCAARKVSGIHSITSVVFVHAVEELIEKYVCESHCLKIHYGCCLHPV
jgi:hypothetical protein